MPTLSERYTVSDLCNKLAASAPWIRKIESLGLLTTSDEKGKGKRRFYTQQEATVISDVVALRQLGLEFEEIGYLKQLEDDLVPFIQKVFEATAHRALNQDWINTIFHGDFSGLLRLDKLTDKERITFLGKLQDHERMIMKIRDLVGARIQLFSGIQQRVNMWIGSRGILLGKFKR